MKPLLFLFLLSIAPLAAAGVKTGEAAPDFVLVNQNGESVKLSDLKGKTVVLEWINFDCPFVKKFYAGGEMQRLQKAAAADGVVWLSINSSAPGKQGNFDPESLKARMAKEGALPAHYLQDSEGLVGRRYAAKTTPHMFVIDAEGTLVYQGAIDSIRSVKAADIPKATNHVVAALEALKAGKPVAQGKTKPYGCSVKYAKEK